MGKATKDLILIAAIAAGGYLILKTTKFGSGLGDAVEGLGGGISTAAAGSGQAIADISGQIASVTGDVAELTAFVGEFGNVVSQEFINIRERSLREAEQETKIDVAAFDIIQEPVAQIRAETELFQEQEQSERDKLKAAEATQWTERITTFDDKLLGFAALAWKYSPTGLLTSWITNIVSAEKTAAPQQSAPEVVGAATTSTSTLTTSSYNSTSQLRAPIPTAPTLSTSAGGGSRSRTSTRTYSESTGASGGYQPVSAPTTSQLRAPIPTAPKQKTSIFTKALNLFGFFR